MRFPGPDFAYKWFVGLILVLISLPTLASFDQDNDGVSDANDNCTLIANPQQYDSNADGIGNRCDSDLNNDGVVDITDNQLLFDFYQVNNLDADFNEDGRITNWDLEILISRIGNAAGPAGIKAPVYGRPRVLTSEYHLSQLRTRLTDQPYAGFWQNIQTYASSIANLIPPCPVDNPDCGAPDNISEHNENSIRAFGDYLPFLAMAYRLTGDQVYLDGARKWMDALVSYEDWATNLDNGTGHILFGMAVAYDWLYDSFSELERQAYREKMAYHANIFHNFLITEGSIWWTADYYSNHNYTNVLGLALTAVALYGETSEADDWIDAVINNFDTVLSLASPDGACTEGTSYWALQMSHLLPYFVAYARFAPEVYQRMLANGYFRNAASFRLYASLPDFYHNADYSDSNRNDFHTSALVLRGLAAIYADPRAQWLAERIDAARQARGEAVFAHWLDMLWYSPAVASQPPDDLPLYRYFDNLGLLFSRSSWQEDAFWSLHKSAPYGGYHAEASGFYPRGHVQPDSGHFMAWSQGRWLLIDDGLVKQKPTENHNLLTFNGSGQLGSDGTWFNAWEVIANGGTVTPIHVSMADDAQYLVTEIASMYRAAADVSSWQRSFIALPEGYQVIRDDVVLNNPGQVENFVHASISAVPTGGASAILNPRGGVPEAIDRSGNGNGGNLVGGLLAEGKSGNAMYLLGIYAARLMGNVDRVFFPSLDNTAFPSSGTLSFWIKASNYSVQGFSNIFDGYSTRRNHILLRTSPGTSSEPISGVEVAFQSDNNADPVFSSSVALSHNEWHHLVITWDSINRWGQLFVNGNLVNGAAIADDDWAPTAQLPGFGTGFNGSIDEAQLFSRPLDNSEIDALFNLEPVTDSLLGHWSFDGIDDAQVAGFREYEYRLLHPANSRLESAIYRLPPEATSGPQGNYLGQLFSSTFDSPGTESIIHFVGDRSTPASYDAQQNTLSISSRDHLIEIDFDDRSVTRTAQ